jgi:hypothetical protein
LKACGLFTGAARKRNRFIEQNGVSATTCAENMLKPGVNSQDAPMHALPCDIRFFRLLAGATSRVELTLNANLLPSKVASPPGEMRPIRQLNGN